MTITQATDLTDAAMLGLGVYRPERVVTNDEICEVLDSTDEWIQTRSGIRTRRFAAEGETLISMATVAAERALAVAGVSAEQLGCVIVATSTHPEHTPASAAQVADNLGKFDPTESETLLIGRGFGVTPAIEQGPDGNLYVVSLSDGAVYRISRAAPAVGTPGTAPATIE